MEHLVQESRGQRLFDLCLSRRFIGNISDDKKFGIKDLTVLCYERNIEDIVIVDNRGGGCYR